MANNLKLGLTNLLMQPGVVLKNGTGGGAPALIETAPYVMANLLFDDRYTLWKTSVLAAATYPVDFDLGSAKSVSAAAAMGYRTALGTGPTIDIQYTNTAYPAGPWTSTTPNTIANLVLNLRDDALEFGSISARWWRFNVNVGANTQFSLAKLFLGVLTDLGGQHSPGAVYTPLGNRSETSLPGGAVVLTELGDDGAEFRIPWKVAAAAVEAAFLTFQTLPGSRLLLWPDSHFYEVYLKGRQLSQARNFQNDYDLVLGRMT
jgi:hypothetical protein